MSDVTQILSQIEQGAPSAAAQLLPLVYNELRELATAKLAGERPGQTLQATALVHEASPPSRVYLLRKLARRHRGLLATAAAAAILLVILATVLGWQTLRMLDAGRLAAERLTDEQQARQSLEESIAAPGLPLPHGHASVPNRRWCPREFSLPNRRVDKFEISDRRHHLAGLFRGPRSDHDTGLSN